MGIVETLLEQTLADRILAISLLAKMALALGLPVGMTYDEEEDLAYRAVCIIDLPAGQVSWPIHRMGLYLFVDIPIYHGVREKSLFDVQMERLMHPGKLPQLGETVPCCCPCHRRDSDLGSSESELGDPASADWELSLFPFSSFLPRFPLD